MDSIFSFPWYLITMSVSQSVSIFILFSKIHTLMTFTSIREKQIHSINCSKTEKFIEKFQKKKQF